MRKKVYKKKKEMVRKNKKKEKIDDSFMKSLA